MGFLETDEDYQAMGVAPPERNLSGVPGQDNEAVAAQINHAGAHLCNWTERGNEIYCTAGSHQHGNHVPPHSKLVGTAKDGSPVFKKVVLLTRYELDKRRGKHKNKK